MTEKKLLDSIELAVDELHTAMSLFTVLKEQLYHYAQPPGIEPSLEAMGNELSLLQLIEAFEGFELSIAHIQSKLSLTTKESC